MIPPMSPCYTQEVPWLQCLTTPAAALLADLHDYAEKKSLEKKSLTY